MKIYNTLTKKKEILQPINEGKINLFVCGPTVYDHAHIGNLRAYLLPDILTRLFLYNGYRVNSTINFTDFGHLTDEVFLPSIPSSKTVSVPASTSGLS